jgi:predicted metal-dependent RNase
MLCVLQIVRGQAPDRLVALSCLPTKAIGTKNRDIQDHRSKLELSDAKDHIVTITIEMEIVVVPLWRIAALGK